MPPTAWWWHPPANWLFRLVTRPARSSPNWDSLFPSRWVKATGHMSKFVNIDKFANATDQVLQYHRYKLRYGTVQYRYPM